MRILELKATFILFIMETTSEMINCQSLILVYETESKNAGKKMSLWAQTADQKLKHNAQNQDADRMQFFCALCGTVKSYISTMKRFMGGRGAISPTTPKLPPVPPSLGPCEVFFNNFTLDLLYIKHNFSVNHP